MSEPILPYAGTSGWSGTDTSQARATQADSNGITSARQMRVLNAVHQTGARGVTIKELRNEFPSIHHGNLSGALSVLHKAGVICRLADTRDRCHIYVLPRYVMGRETQPHGRRTSTPLGHVYTLREIKDGTGFRPGARFIEIEDQ